MHAILHTTTGPVDITLVDSYIWADDMIVALPGTPMYWADPEKADTRSMRSVPVAHITFPCMFCPAEAPAQYITAEEEPMCKACVHAHTARVKPLTERTVRAMIDAHCSMLGAARAELEAQPSDIRGYLARIVASQRTAVDRITNKAA